MADQHGILEIEVLEEFVQIVGPGVHVVALPGLAGAAVAATVVGDDAVAVVGEEEHLVLPVVAVQGPAMREYYDGAGFVAPIFVVYLGLVFEGEDRHVC